MEAYVDRIKFSHKRHRTSRKYGSYAGREEGNAVIADESVT